MIARPRTFAPLVFLLSLACGGAQVAPVASAGGDGLIRVPSAVGFSQTVAQLTAAIEGRPLRVIATVPHSAAAASQDLTLRPTTLVLFGNPAVGSPLMDAAPTLALDLPQRMLVLEEGGRVWLVYNDPQFLFQRHGLAGREQAAERIRGVLAAIAEEAGAE